MPLLARSWASLLFTVERGKPRSFSLHLDRRAELTNSAGNDHQIPMLDFVLTPNHLADRPDRVDNGRSGWVCLEGLQRLQDTGAGGLGRKRKHRRLSPLQPRDPR